MSIALGGSSQARPTAVFKLQVNGSVLPGYCQSLDDPLSFRVASNTVAGRDGGPLTPYGASNRTVRASMRILTRLGQGSSGRAHLDDCLEQYRSALAIAARQVGTATLHLGDSDRYLPAVFESASAPLAAPDSRAITYSLNFRTNSWYTASTVLSSTKSYVSDTRISGSVNGSVTYTTGRYSGTQGAVCDANGEFFSFGANGNLTLNSGSSLIWIKPQYASTNNTTSHPVIRVSGSTDYWDAGWDHTTQRYVVKGSGSAGAVTYATAGSLTFSAGEDVLLAFTWDSNGTRVWAGVAGGNTASGSSATPLFTNVGTPGIFYVGGHASATANSVLSDWLTFSTALTSDQVTHVLSGTAPYDPFDTDLPTTLLLDHRFNGSEVAHANSNGIFLDIPDTRATYPVITINGGNYLRMSGTNTGKRFTYAAGASPAVTIDCGTFAVIDSAGTNKSVNMEDVDFGIAYTGSQRAGLEALVVSGTATSVTMAVTPRYER